MSIPQINVLYVIPPCFRFYLRFIGFQLVFVFHSFSPNKKAALEALSSGTA